jgi:hypothetical protein
MKAYPDEIKKSKEQLRKISDTIPNLALYSLQDGSAEFFNQC